MLILAHRVLHYLGATEILDVTNNIEPSTESEFLQLKFNSPSEITWDMYKDAYPIVEKDIGTKLLRIERNRLLAASDWVMTIDNYESLSNKEEWVAYRKALRDITNTMTSFVWKDHNKLDFSKMNMPVQPPIVRNS